jgi:hypothetical protein
MDHGFDDAIRDADGGPVDPDIQDPAGDGMARRLTGDYTESRCGVAPTAAPS